MLGLLPVAFFGETMNLLGQFGAYNLTFPSLRGCGASPHSFMPQWR
jgi:hypothetical protein